MDTSSKVVLIYPHGDLPPVDEFTLESRLVPTLRAAVPAIIGHQLVMGGAGHRYQACLELTIEGSVLRVVDALVRSAELVRPPYAETVEPLLVLLDGARHRAIEQQFVCAGS